MGCLRSRFIRVLRRGGLLGFQSGNLEAVGNCTRHQLALERGGGIGTRRLRYRGFSVRAGLLGHWACAAQPTADDEDDREDYGRDERFGEGHVLLVHVAWETLRDSFFAGYKRRLEEVRRHVSRKGALPVEGDDPPAASARENVR